MIATQKSGSATGYILLLTVMLLALMTVVVTRLYYQQAGYVPLVQFTQQSEQARLLALGGLSVAMSQLDFVAARQAEDSDQMTAAQEALEKFYFIAINRVQTLELSAEVDGVNGKIKFMINCENGKFALNKLYDFKQHKFIKNYQELLQNLLGRQQLDPKLITDLAQFLQARKRPLNDITDLLMMPSWAAAWHQRIFPVLDASDKTEQLYLSDLFTVDSAEAKLNLLLLSPAVLRLLGAKNLVDKTARIQAVQNWLTDRKERGFRWDQLFKTLYGVESAVDMSADLSELLGAQFTGDLTFAVTAEGRVGLMRQKIFAIIRARSKTGKEMSFDVIKQYWI